MPPDPNATLSPEQDPLQDTLADGQSEDTAQDTQEAPQADDDWKRKYDEAQKLILRQGQELGILRRNQPDAEEGDEPEADDEVESYPDPVPDSPAYERDSWTLAEQLYGGEAIAAYETAYDLVERATTPADYVAAFEAYHEARLRGNAPKAATKAAAAATPQAPVDANRADASPDPTDLDRKAEAARAAGDSRGWFAAQIERMGQGPRR